jgi:pyrroline-5-carboxylate reductase
MRRLAAHRRGRAARYTRGRGPVRLAAVWWCPTRGAALRLEWLLKRMPHTAKRRLAGGAALVRIIPKARALGVRRMNMLNMRNRSPVLRRYARMEN